MLSAPFFVGCSIGFALRVKRAKVFAQGVFLMNRDKDAFGCWICMEVVAIGHCFHILIFRFLVWLVKAGAGIEPAPGGWLGNVCGNVIISCRCFVEDTPVAVPHWANQTRKHWQPLKLSSVVGVSVGPCAFISVRSENLHHSAKRGGQYNFEAAVVFDVYDSGSWLCVHFFVFVFGFRRRRGGFDLG